MDLKANYSKDTAFQSTLSMRRATYARRPLLASS